MNTKKLRRKSYYNLNESQKNLHEESKSGFKDFKDLYELIVAEENILLAYRTIKSNSGAKTAGTDLKNISDLAETDQSQFIEMVKKKLSNYKPSSVRRVMIPKSNGKLRPLGIPSILDRLIQQMFLNILEPICEGKFYNHSYGFRPLRTTRHAVARIQSLVNINRLHFTVDIDIEGFFDNVNHNKLIKQLWNIGIKDKRVLAIVGKMLKAPIKGEGIPEKGVPQGGILSPLLSNVVLNDLDQWVAGQWDTFQTRRQYSGNDVKIRTLRTSSKMKEGFLVRYADDFRIMARDYETALKWYHAVVEYLDKRLNLKISKDKSKIINLRKKSSEFLGFKIKAVKKGKKRIAKTNVSDKNIKQITDKLRDKIKTIQKYSTPNNVRIYNATVLGVHQFYKYATHVVKDFNDIEYRLLRTLRSRLKRVAKYGYPILHEKSTYRKFYKVTRKTFKVGKDNYLFPIGDIKTTSNFNFSQSQNPYENTLNFSWDKEIVKLMKSRLSNRTVEYMDNRLSIYSQQKGNCAITKIQLPAEFVHCHHKLPVSLGGTDEYKNLVIVHASVHRLIHATQQETINKYMEILSINATQLRKINQLRKLCRLEKIINT
ncbi:MAG: group II intron reverse transcriptase/maturase [Planococcus donghaensis]